MRGPTEVEDGRALVRGAQVNELVGNLAEVHAVTGQELAFLKD
jgi:hypothetical protein